MQKANTSKGFSSLVVLLTLALKYICGESHTHINMQKDKQTDIWRMEWRLKRITHCNKSLTSTAERFLV